MHQKILLTIMLFFFNLLSAMQPTTQRGWISAGFHWFDKRINQIPYITDNDAFIVSQNVCRLKPDHQYSIPFSKDSIILENIHKAFEREGTLISVFKKEISTKSNKIKKEEISNGYFSLIISNALKGYKEFQKNKTEKILNRLETIEGISKQPQKIQEKKQPNELTFEIEEILNESPNFLEIISNWFGKRAETIAYLTNSKSACIAELMIRFKDEQFNPSDQNHLKLLKKALKRQEWLIAAIETGISYDDFETISTLYKQVNIAYFSPHAIAIIRGYLESVRKRQEMAQKIAEKENERQQVLFKKDIESKLTATRTGPTQLPAPTDTNPGLIGALFKTEA